MSQLSPSSPHTPPNPELLSIREPKLTYYLNLRVHHLSSFFIQLFELGSEPYKIVIKYQMINYMNTPDNLSTSKVFFSNDIHISRYEFGDSTSTFTHPSEILIKKENQYHFDGFKNSNETLLTDSNINKFNELYKILKENIQVILNINKDKETKEDKKDK